MVEVLFTMTCFACPEAYDVSIDEGYVGHIRLRHGRLIMRDAENNELLTIHMEGEGHDGGFNDLATRDAYLVLAAEAFSKEIGHDGEVWVSIDKYWDPNEGLTDEDLDYILSACAHVKAQCQEGYDHDNRG